MVKDFKNTYWTTKNGSRIKVKDLSLEHLKNIILFLKRKQEYVVAAPPVFQGEMAQLISDISYEHHISYIEETISQFERYYNKKLNTLNK